MSEIKIKLAAGTNVGLVRKNNEDNFVVNRDLSQTEWFVPQSSETISLGKFGSLLVVADGMGGTNAGEVASAIAIETIQDAFTTEKLEKIVTQEGIVNSEEAIEEFLTKVVKTADLNIVNTSKEDSSTQGMGTTIVLAWILNDKAYITWCGDSRCYVFNANSGFYRLSKDHSYVQDLVDQGKLNPENTFDHPYSNIITRCLGDPTNRSNPDFRSYSLKDGDILLLCSDGLCGLCHDEEIMEIIEANQEDLGVCKDQLIEAALAAGGYDNVTIVLCHIIQEGDAAPKTKLNNTVFSKPNNHKFQKVLLLLLILILAIGFYCYKIL
ncbi:protein phosphatase 2C domain-containing protein [Bacteroides sp. GD17]|jgi:serine/threonine protein phosphatase PrpC|uniref:PP2C family protein-serine/threonine phosphatase n=1 Tax=Bacteroides sp. GD17 TaxID=3139826 RepID=UPI0025E8CDF0|nr:protein phosphatase 2C domain-containing protein [uncultured Bacteroides sp.]